MADISMVNIVFWLPEGMLDFGQFLNAMTLHPKINKIEYTVGGQSTVLIMPMPAVCPNLILKLLLYRFPYKVVPTGR